MSWQFWIGWSGSAMQLAIAAWWWVYARRSERRAIAKLRQFGIDTANEQSAFLIAMGWHWGTLVERRNWVERMMGVNDV